MGFQVNFSSEYVILISVNVSISALSIAFHLLPAFLSHIKVEKP